MIGWYHPILGPLTLPGNTKDKFFRGFRACHWRKHATWIFERASFFRKASCIGASPESQALFDNLPPSHRPGILPEIVAPGKVSRLFSQTHAAPSPM